MIEHFDVSVQEIYHYIYILYLCVFWLFSAIILLDRLIATVRLKLTKQKQYGLLLLFPVVAKLERQSNENARELEEMRGVLSRYMASTENSHDMASEEEDSGYSAERSSPTASDDLATTHRDRGQGKYNPAVVYMEPRGVEVKQLKKLSKN